MQIKLFVRWALLIVWVLFSSFSGLAQNDVQMRAAADAGRPVVRGERPVPDYSRVPDADIYPGVVRIRIREAFSDQLREGTAKTGGDGYVQFGIAGIDDLNRQSGVTSARQTFFIALRDKQYEMRHRQWGLHLWYDLTIGKGEDVRAVVRRYAALPEVESAELVVRAILSSTGSLKSGSFIPNDSLYPQQWHYHNTGQAGGTPGCDIRLPEAWELEKGDTAVTVSIMDQGVDYSHPDLAGNIWPGKGYNFYADTSLIEPCLHGTHVAGTIAANTNNGKGVSGIAGGDGSGNGVRLMSCQIISAENQITEANIPNAYIWAADRGAAISQNSWNFPVASTALFEAIDYFIANGGGSTLNGGIMICSAGNADSNMISYPACYSPCITVAATSNKDIRAVFSNYGPWVDLSAPGGNVYPYNEEDILSTLPGGGYGFLAGTSMACPHVSGVAALIVSLAKGHLNPEDVKDILLNTTDDISSLNPEYEGMIGTGRLNGYKALLFTQGYLDPAIPKPVGSFTVTGGNLGDMHLQWNLNETQDSVMLAYGQSKTFGTPSGNYLPGDTIAGGGRVLYKGKLAAYEQTGLDSNTVYYYSIWSLRSSKYSLIARRASDTVHSSPHGIGDQTEAGNNGIRIIPNPAGSVATLVFELAKPGTVIISMYDQGGRKVGSLSHNFVQAGTQQMQISVSRWPAGMYQVRMESGRQTATGRMVIK